MGLNTVWSQSEVNSTDHPIAHTDLATAINSIVPSNGTISLPKLNTGNALTVVHPDSTDVAYDSGPLAAITVLAPPTATTRNFDSGIWVITNGASVDKGRGIGVQNLGQSDAVYIQQDGANGSGLVVAMNSGNTGGTGLVVAIAAGGGAVGSVFRQQSPNGGTATLIQVQGGVAGTAELVQFSNGSGITGKTGIIFRMAQGSVTNACLSVHNSADAEVFKIDSAGTISGSGGLTQTGNSAFTAAAGGTALTLTGFDATSSNFSLAIKDSTTANLLVVRNDGQVTVSKGPLLSSGSVVVSAGAIQHQVAFATNVGVQLNNAGYLYSGSGVPSNAVGNNGDIYFRTDGGSGTTIYQRRTGTWTATGA